MLDTPSSILRVSDVESLAREKLPHMAWEYLDAGAGDELTLGWNRAAFDRIRLMPRVLADVSQIDTRISLFSRELPHPILLAPVAYNKLFHPEGEMAAARGAAMAGAVYCMSTMANVSIEDVAPPLAPPQAGGKGEGTQAGGKGEGPQAREKLTLWYQLYVQQDRTYTARLIERAVSAGVEALVVTVDTPVLGNRVRETRAGFALPPGLDRAMLRDVPAASQLMGHISDADSIYYPLVNPAMTWKDIEWICSVSKVPVVLKGILNPEDAERAHARGARGIIVSNHGARNLDTVPATIDVLPRISARVRGAMPVLFDGGIRRGTDILKALALGANAVLIGRPYVYGLAVGGAEGVATVIKLLLKELKIAMALCGRASLREIDRALIES